MNSKWIKDLNLRPETIISQRKMQGGSLGIGLGPDFSEKTVKAQAAKTKINKWGCIKLKRFCTDTETILKWKRQPTGWEKTFVNHMCGKELTSKTYEELIQLNSENQFNVKRGQKP